MTHGEMARKLTELGWEAQIENAGRVDQNTLQDLSTAAYEIVAKDEPIFTGSSQAFERSADGGISRIASEADTYLLGGFRGFSAAKINYDITGNNPESRHQIGYNLLNPNANTRYFVPVEAVTGVTIVNEAFKDEPLKQTVDEALTSSDTAARVMMLGEAFAKSPVSDFVVSVCCHYLNWVNPPTKYFRSITTDTWVRDHPEAFLVPLIPAPITAWVEPGDEFGIFGFNTNRAYHKADPAAPETEEVYSNRRLCVVKKAIDLQVFLAFTNTSGFEPA